VRGVRYTSTGKELRLVVSKGKRLDPQPPPPPVRVMDYVRERMNRKGQT
jgi:hypothetical protein